MGDWGKLTLSGISNAVQILTNYKPMIKDPDACIYRLQR